MKSKRKNKIIILMVSLVVLFLGVVYFFNYHKNEVTNEVNKNDLITLISPLPNSEISSPLIITGKARGFWFFEASFPVFLTDWDGLIIAQGIAKAESDWMTEDYVPFRAILNYDQKDILNKYSKNGTLILKKDNPSGLPENDDALEIPVVFK